MEYLLVLIDPFTRWIEAFPSRTAKAIAVSKFLLKEIILRFWFPKSLQSDNGASFTAKMTQQVSPALGNYHLYSSWRPQARLKKKKERKKPTQTVRLCRETSEICVVSLLPISLLWNRMVPKGILKLSPFETTYGKPFLTLGLV